MIRLEAVSKTYKGPAGPVHAVDGVTLEIGRGEVFGVIGRSGAGKSTLIRCVNLLERPDAGRVLVDGIDLTALPTAELRTQRRQIGMIFQHFNLLTRRTVAENVALPLELAGIPAAARRARVERLLALVHLSEKAGEYPAKLSGGQKQRVGIARALALEPKILLCDEATSALDPQTTRSILALLRDITRRLGVTVLLITHEMSVVAEICDRVAVMAEGRVVESGSVFDLLARPSHQATRDLLRAGDGEEALPPWVAETLSPSPLPGTGAVVRLTFTGPEADAPIVTELIRSCDVSLNILQGSVGRIQDRPYGTLTVVLEGAVERALNYLAARHVSTEVLGYVPSSRRLAV